MNITLEKQEAVLLFLYCGDDRNETIDNLQQMKMQLHIDEQDLQQMTDSLIGKLQQIEDKDFEAALILADDTV
ncbi:MAG: hypothetical protein IKF16_11815 [Lachnospiraceae bacterium]|nr:hypothetical protein [Lachnospiraceae bacterium]